MADSDIKKKVNIRNRSLRARRKSSSDEEEDEGAHGFSSKIEEMKVIQKLREKPRGVDIVGLTLGQVAQKEESKTNNDPFKVKTGGMVNLKNVTVKKVDDAYDVGIGTQFSAETNKRDEDEEMMKYIEDELSKKKRLQKGDGGAEDDGGQKAYYSPEEAALQAVPAHLRASSSQRSEEMLSNQMLSGIPEVDLGIESKIKNIEATEEAKLKLLWNQRNKKEGPSDFVPTNITVNFTQPNKINVDENDVKKVVRRTEKRPAVEPEQGGKRPNKTTTDRATDDMHYEKFKKQFRRY